MSSSVVGPRSSKARLKTKLGPKKGLGHCLVVCSTPLQLSQSQRNRYIWEVHSANQWYALKTAMPPAGTRQHKGPNSSPWQGLTTTSHNQFQKFNEWGHEVLPHPPYSSDLSPSNNHCFKHLKNHLRAKCFHNKQEAENSFQEFHESWSMDFYATEINISHWQKWVDCNGSYFD